MSIYWMFNLQPSQLQRHIKHLVHLFVQLVCGLSYDNSNIYSKGQRDLNDSETRAVDVHKTKQERVRA
jgi:hypothetical protein